MLPSLVSYAARIFQHDGQRLDAEKLHQSRDEDQQFESNNFNNSYTETDADAYISQGEIDKNWPDYRNGIFQGGGTPSSSTSSMTEVQRYATLSGLRATSEGNRDSSIAEKETENRDSQSPNFNKTFSALGTKLGKDKSQTGNTIVIKDESSHAIYNDNDVFDKANISGSVDHNQQTPRPTQKRQSLDNSTIKHPPLPPPTDCSDSIFKTPAAPPPPPSRNRLFESLNGMSPVNSQLSEQSRIDGSVSRNKLFIQPTEIETARHVKGCSAQRSGIQLQRPSNSNAFPSVQTKNNTSIKGKSIQQPSVPSHPPNLRRRESPNRSNSSVMKKKPSLTNCKRISNNIERYVPEKYPLRIKCLFEDTPRDFQEETSDDGCFDQSELVRCCEIPCLGRMYRITSTIIGGLLLPALIALFFLLETSVMEDQLIA